MTVDKLPILDDRYALDEVIGRGGMADVYRATDRLLLRPVAVKVLREVTDQGQRERFTAEARTLASLNHPGLITLLDAGILADRPYLVMELVTGPTLSACIAEEPLLPDRVQDIGHQLTRALAYAHDQGVVHRDVKPSNVLLCGEDRALLADFGIARLIGAVEHYTKTGAAVGSPAYLAPEQVAGEEVGPAADVFSLGLVLLEALTGVRAYTGSAIEAAVARLHAAPAISGELPAAWRSLVSRMTQREPERRPTADEVASELGDPEWAARSGPPLDQASVATGELELTDDALRASSSPAGAEPAPDDARPSRRRIWAAALAGLLAVSALVAVLVIWPLHGAQSNDSHPTTPSGVPNGVPSGVPSRLQQPLADLHEAVEGSHS
jgi:eukaryotic-like serine/threonine-protein kinase